MAQILSFMLFGSVLLVSITTIVATIKAELPWILRALGLEPHATPPLESRYVARVRITRPLQAPTHSPLRVAA